MAENDQNVGTNVNVSDLSSISIDDESLEGINIDEVSASAADGNVDSNQVDINQGGSLMDENVFLNTGDEGNTKAQTLNKETNFGKYVRRIFISGVIIILGVLFLALAYSFDLYVKQASKSTVDPDYQSYVTRYKTNLGKIKDLLGYSSVSNYQKPNGGGELAKNTVNSIINATDIDYIEKKDILSSYVSSLSRDITSDTDYIGTIKERIAKQGFLPNELELLLSEDQGIDTIQRSLNALEIIKFSTATRVFSYMNTALVTLSEMIRLQGANVSSIRQLFEQLNSNGENDIAAYVYMCYLNPYETNANCDRIGDLDLYYHYKEDNTIYLPLFKNTMNAISQLLERSDTTLFSITFNGFDAQAKNLSFNVEVYTNQDDEKVLIAQGWRSPTIFILKNVINLLKLSKFIIGADINTSSIHVEERTIDVGGITRNVHYSNMDFSVPIQKNTEREIFDYIDLDVIKEMLTDRGLKESENKESAEGENVEKNLDTDEIEKEDDEIIENIDTVEDAEIIEEDTTTIEDIEIVEDSDITEKENVDTIESDESKIS